MFLSTSSGRGQRTERDTLDDVADAYVRLVLAVQRHNPNYLDAYFGPPDWRAEARRGRPRPVADLLALAQRLLEKVRAFPVSVRRDFLERQLVAVESYGRILSGEHLSWRQTLRTILDAEPLRFRPDEVASVRQRLGAILPGRGSISARLGRFLRYFEIPKARLRAVVEASAQVTRARAKALFSLPSRESVRFRLVREKPWAAYTWYLGRGQSLIEINLDHRHHPQGLLDAIAHEAYPGHHTFHSVREHLLVRGRGWREHAISPLMSPLSLISEGAAYMALDVIMKEQETREFVREVVAPLAGVNKGDLEAYFAVNSARGFGEHQNAVIMEAARRLHEDGATSRQMVAFMTDCGFSRRLAYSVVRFAKTYNAYICSYRLGLHAVKSYLGRGPDRVARYRALLCQPLTPSALRAARALPPGD